mgnify:CR=1 FL=1
MALMVFSLLLTAGCDPQGSASGQNAAQSSAQQSSSSTSSSSGKSSGSTTSSAAKSESLTITAYYPNEDGTKLLASKRTVQLGKEDKYTAAMESLLTGAKDKGQTTIIPKQTKLRSVKVAGGVAKVDLTQAVQKNFVGGSTGEEMLVGSIVDTLTEFPEVKKVQILVEGKTIDSLSGHMDLSEPIARMDQLLK